MKKCHPKVGHPFLIKKGSKNWPLFWHFFGSLFDPFFRNWTSVKWGSFVTVESPGNTTGNAIFGHFWEFVKKGSFWGYHKSGHFGGPKIPLFWNAKKWSLVNLSITDPFVTWAHFLWTLFGRPRISCTPKLQKWGSKSTPKWPPFLDPPRYQKWHFLGSLFGHFWTPFLTHFDRFTPLLHPIPEK